MASTKSPSRAWLPFAVILISNFSRIASAVTITSDDPEFTLQVPDSYVQLHDTDKIHFDGINLFGFASTNATYGVPDSIVLVQRYNRTIPHVKIDLSTPEVKDLLASVGVSDEHIVTGHWNSFDISLIDGLGTHDNRQWAICAAPVPLKGEAIQILVLVRPDQGEIEAENITRDFLDGLTGPSNWSTSDSADLRQDEMIMRGLIKLVIVVGSLIGATLAMVAFFKRENPQPRPTPPPLPAVPPPFSNSESSL